MFKFLKKVFNFSKTKYGYPANAVFIDVSTKAQYEEVHLENALNIPLEVIYKTFNTLTKYQVPLVVICTTGIRSQIAFEMLYKLGVKVYYGGNWKYMKDRFDSMDEIIITN